MTIEGVLLTAFDVLSMMAAERKHPVKVQFLGIMPTLFAHCQHCMQVMHETGMQPYSEQLEEYPEEVRQQYFALSEIAQKLKAEFGETVTFDAIDTASLQGVWMTLRYGLWKTPSVLIQGKKAFTRLPSYAELRSRIQETLTVTAASESTG